MQLEFDPVAKLQEFLVLFIVIVLITLAWLYRDRLLLFFTGDDVLHLNGLEMFYFILCKWCGLCDGEWTRCVTRHCCCCPRRLRGQNLVKKVGQVFGLSPVMIEIRNLIVGDLPTNDRADWYIALDCENMPTMVTSVAEAKSPKIIHFPEILTLRLRDSTFAEHVRIEVRILKVMGYTTIARCALDPTDVISWAKASDPAGRVKRIELKPTESIFGDGLVVETPPWIAITFGEPLEIRDLTHFIKDGDMKTVRTATTRDQQGRAADYEATASHMPDTNAYRDISIVQFKEEMPLLNRDGQEIDEPPESTLGQIALLRNCLGYFYSMCNFIMVIVLVVTMSSRFYVWSCYRQFRNLTIAYLQDSSQFPVAIDKIASIEKQCKKEFGGTGAKEGTKPCLPSTEQVISFCGNFTKGTKLDAENGPYPSMCDPRHGCEANTQIRPTAGKRLIYDVFNIKGVQGAYCFDGICAARNKIVMFDKFLFAFWIFAIFFVLFAKLVFARITKWAKRRQQIKWSEEVKTMRKTRSEALDIRDEQELGGRDRTQYSKVASSK